MNDEELSVQINDLLWHEDFMGIGIGIDSPKDEFRIETKMLIKALGTAKNEDDFIYKVIEIFNQQFEPIPPFDFDNTKELASKIYALGQRN